MADKSSQDVQVKLALKWLMDISSIGNKNASTINAILQSTLVENARIRGVLMDRLAPALKATDDKMISKDSVLFALIPIRDLLGYTTPYVAAGPVTPPVK